MRKPLYDKTFEAILLVAGVATAALAIFATYQAVYS